MSNCENCRFFREVPVIDKETGDTYYEPKCSQGVALTSENVVYVKNCEDFEEVKDDKQTTQNS